MSTWEVCNNFWMLQCLSWRFLTFFDASQGKIWFISSPRRRRWTRKYPARGTLEFAEVGRVCPHNGADSLLPLKRRGCSPFSPNRQGQDRKFNKMIHLTGEGHELIVCTPIFTTGSRNLREKWLQSQILMGFFCSSMGCPIAARVPECVHDPKMPLSHFTLPV